MEDPVDAIAHPGRRELLRLVIDGEHAAGVLAARTGMSQPSASQHLKILRDAGLVTVRVDGPRRLYSVDTDGLERLRSELDAFWPRAIGSLKDAAEGEGD